MRAPFGLGDMVMDSASVAGKVGSWFVAPATGAPGPLATERGDGEAALRADNGRRVGKAMMNTSDRSALACVLWPEWRRRAALVEQGWL